MKRNKTFCEECRDDVGYLIREREMAGSVKGKESHYMGKEAHCAQCGALVYVPEVNDANLEALYEVYRKENGIVPLEIIRAIPEKYAIGKRPFALLLGWGEQTFSRYYEGDMPTKQYSDILTRIYHEPSFYAELLEANKGRLKPLAYEKSRKAVDVLLAAATASAAPGGKINAVIQYLLNQCEDITPLALQKALYYIQGFHYAFFGSFLFEEDCQAWAHGPVYREVYFQYRDYKFNPIEKTESFDAGIFSSNEKVICDSIIHYICCYSGKVLERFTHNEMPWLAARGDLPVTASSERLIGKELIGEYFKAVKEKYHMVNPHDIKGYAQDMFLQG